MIPKNGKFFSISTTITKKNNGAVKLLQSKFGITLILIRKYMNQGNRFIVLKCIVFKE